MKSITTIKIEKNIPIPTKSKHYSVFPFEKMCVGDSFLVTREQFEKTSFIELRMFVYKKAKEYKIDNFVDDMFKFHIERHNNGVRCFRVQ